MSEEIKRGLGRPPKCTTPDTPNTPCVSTSPADLTKEQLLNLYNNKMEQFEKLIESYREREQKLQDALKQATLEYNARTQYFMDCVKHAYVSMQFAVNASTPTTKE